MKLEKALQNTPEVVAIELTNRCNLNCVYCTKKNMGNIDLSQEMQNTILENIKSMKRVILCGIGETMLYPEVYKFVNQLEDKKVCAVTNGTIPIDYKRLNEKNNMEQIIFSIDALRQEILEKISGTYRFDILLENLKAYQEYVLETGRKISLVLNCTINEYNLEEFLPLISFAKEYNIETIHFSLPRGKEDFIREHKQKLMVSLEQAKKNALENKIFFVDPFDICCVYLKWVTPYITMEGDLYACSETLYINEKLGSLLEMPLQEIWKKKEYIEFTKGLSCKNCKFLSNSKLDFKDRER